VNTTQILNGDSIEMMRTLDDNSVNTCVTSPPYFGLRDYGHDGQIGLEETPEKYIDALVNVFREVKRVLRKDGTLWLNIGDSYASYRDGKATPDTTRGESNGTLVPKGIASNRMASTFLGSNIKHKDLIGIPWRLAFALQSDGWYLRQDIIWNKPNPMPESVQDRCTKSHEYIFLLAKSPKYFFDSEAIKEKAAYAGAKRGISKNISPSGITDFGGKIEYDTRNKRSVWTVNTRSYSGSHFATFPTELITPCILAGCPKDGVVLDPFGGSGTTAFVANENGRNAILCEINPEYVELSKERLRSVQPPLFTI
jgi:DNA modification methylase